jgi:hypothetical protein
MIHINRKFGIIAPLILIGVSSWIVIAKLSREDPSEPGDEGKDRRQRAPAGSWSGRDGVARFAERVRESSSGDRDRLVREALASGNPGIIEGPLVDLLQDWMSSDERGFLAFLHDLELSDPAGELWAVLGPVLLDLISSSGDPSSPSDGMSGIIRRAVINTARTNPRFVLDWARKWLDGPARDDALSSVVIHLVKQDAAGAQAILAEIDSAPAMLAASHAVGTQLGKTDPDAGLQWARSLSGDDERAHAISVVLAAMANTSPDEAMAVYRETVLAMQEAFQSMQQGIFVQEGLSTDKEQGLSSAPTDPNLEHLHRAAYQIGSSLAAANPKAALEWARGLTAEQGGTNALEGIYAEWASRDGAAAWDAFRIEATPDPGVVGRLFESWALEDPVSAAGKVRELPAGSLRDSAIDALVAGWADGAGQTAAIGRWAEGLPTVADRDRAFSAVAMAGASDDPVTAWKQIGKITDVETQGVAFEKIFPELADFNPVVARQALESLDLPAVQKERLRKLLEP